MMSGLEVAMAHVAGPVSDRKEQIKNREKASQECNTREGRETYYTAV